MENILFERRRRVVVLLLLVLLPFATATFYRSAGPGSNNVVEPQGIYDFLYGNPGFTPCLDDKNEAQKICIEKGLFRIHADRIADGCSSGSYRYYCIGWPESWMGERHLTSCAKDKKEGEDSCKEKGLFRVVSDSPDYLIPCDDDVSYRYICTNWPIVSQAGWTPYFSFDDAEAWGYDGEDAVANLAVDWCDVHIPGSDIINSVVSKVSRGGVYFFSWEYSRLYTPCLEEMSQADESCAEKKLFRAADNDLDKRISCDNNGYQYLCEDWPEQYELGWTPYFSQKDALYLGYEGNLATFDLAKRWCSAHDYCRTVVSDGFRNVLRNDVFSLSYKFS